MAINKSFTHTSGHQIQFQWKPLESLQLTGQISVGTVGGSSTPLKHASVSYPSAFGPPIVLATPQGMGPWGATFAVTGVNNSQIFNDDGSSVAFLNHGAFTCAMGSATLNVQIPFRM